MRATEKRTLKVIELIEEGKNREEISSHLGLTSATVRLYESRIAKYITKELCPFRSISKKLESSPQTIEFLSHQECFTNQSEFSIKKQKKEKTPPLKKHRKKGEIALFSIDAPYNNINTLEEIGDNFNITREAVRQSLKKENIDFQELKKDAEEKRNKEISKLTNIVYHHILKISEERGIAFAKAIEYKFNSKQSDNTNSIPLERLEKLFKVYYDAEKRNEKLSLDKLAEISGFNSLNSVSRTLKKVGLKPMIKNEVERHPLTKEQKELVNSMFKIPLNYPDISYFVNIPQDITQYHFKKIKNSGEKRPETKLWIKEFYKENRTKLTYRLADKIYRDIDNNSKYNLGFSLEEIAELNNVNSEVIQYVIQNREEIGEVINKTKKYISDLESKISHKKL